MIPGLNKKDNNDVGNSDYKTGNKDAHEKTLNEKSVDSKNNDELFENIKNEQGEDVQEKVENVIDVAAGNYHTLILKKDGTVWTTGLNNYGQLGNGTKTNSSSLSKVKLNEQGDYLENVVKEEE